MVPKLIGRFILFANITVGFRKTGCSIKKKVKEKNTIVEFVVKKPRSSCGCRNFPKMTMNDREWGDVFGSW